MDSKMKVLTVRIRDGSGRISPFPIETVGTEHLAGIRPIRSLSWYRGQRSFPGWYWSSTMHAHVSYDSRLELARLLLADFDSSVEAIVAQPFQLVETVESEVHRRQIPDYLLVHSDRAVTVVNVKTPEALVDEEVRRTYAWVTEVLKMRGWRHEVWSGTDATLLSNVRFLAGFRCPRYPPALLRMIVCEAPGRSISETREAIGRHWEQTEVTPAILHLIWGHTLQIGMDEPLGFDTVLEDPSCV